MGPCIGTENEEVPWNCFPRGLQGATSFRPAAQTKDKELLCGQGACSGCSLSFPTPHATIHFYL